MTDTQILILLISITIIIAIVIFILSGLFIVKSDEVCVFEKFYKYYTTKTKGIYFFTPFLTRRVGKYKLENQYLKINLKSNTIYLIYKIKDAKLYHYHNPFKDEIYNRLIVSENNNDNLIEIIHKTCIEYGLEIISIKQNEELID